jgi:hypothetical protein
MANEYKTLVQRYSLMPGEELPPLPTFGLRYPGLEFVASDFYFREGAPIFDDYGPALVSTQSGIVDAKVMTGLADEEVEAVGTISVPQVVLARLKFGEESGEWGERLFDLSYRLQMAEERLGREELVAANRDLYLALNDYDREALREIERGRRAVDLPDKQKYQENAPLLFFKDPWGRWLGLWTTDFRN